MFSFDCYHADKLVIFSFCCYQMDRMNKAREEGWRHLMKSSDDKDEVSVKFDVDGFV